MAEDSLIKVSASVAFSINAVIIALEIIGKRKRALDTA
jgi:hypothetical protein